MTSSLKHRKNMRYSEWDYSSEGAYFITVCTKDKKAILCTIGCDDLGTPKIILSPYGSSVRKYIDSIEEHYDVNVDNYVIMPNHIHLLIFIKENGTPTRRPTELIPNMMAALKKMTNKEAGCDLWQTSYYDHIIRNEADYRVRYKYIDDNPAKWQDDEYF